LISAVAAQAEEQLRVRAEFQTAFARGLIVRGFVRDESAPHFLLYER
jgi:hypothetical protein